MHRSTRRRWRVAGLIAATLVTMLGLGLGGFTSAQANSAPTVATVARSVQASPGTIGPVVGCSSLATLDLSALKGAPTELTSATTTTINGGTYCAVSGYISPQEQFTIDMPVSTWQGDYLQLGCGGFCGGLPPASPLAAAGCTQVAGNEFVMAADDQGHASPSSTDGIWARDDMALRINFGYTSEHLLRLVANALITRYYARPPSVAFFDGCSDGGHEALDLAERYPADFKGILAGAPAGNWGGSMAESLAWGARSNMDQNGNVILTSAKLSALHAAVLKACANADGYIADPRACTFNPASIECPRGTDTDACLTPQEVTVVQNEYLGPHDSQGNEFFGGGLPYGSELAWDGWVTSDGGPAKGLEDYQFAQNYLADMAFVHSPASFSLSSWKFDIASYQSMEELAGIYDATSPDLSAFKRADGKLIIYSGWADQAIPPFSQVDYYAAVEKETGGFTASQSFTRLYMVPGGYHCLKGGDPSVTADFLTPLINWVEDEQAPSSLTLAVTGQSTGHKITSLTVAPFNALAPAPKNNGLNSNYKIYGQAALYAKSHEKV